MAIQPNHRLTAIPLYVFPHDSAWDTEKINRELSLFDTKDDAEEGEPAPPIPWATRDDHPVVRYRNGEGRFDLDTVKDYFRQGIKPTCVVLRRASFPHAQNLQSLLEREVLTADGRAIGRNETLTAAIRYSVESCDDLTLKAPRSGLTDLQLDTLREQLGDDWFALLGYACLSVNRSLSPAEAFR